MEADVLRCNGCGATVAAEALRCSHCGAWVATQACPSCLTMMLSNAEYCLRCGSPAVPWHGEDSALPCPKCGQKLVRGEIGTLVAHHCPGCFGVWVDTATFQHVCRNAEEVALAPGLTAVGNPPGTVPLEPVRYVRCPECRDLMHRMNFAQCSGVVVDSCRDHGTWLDAQELQRIIQFIRSGGLDRAREREKEELASERRRLQAARSGTPSDSETIWVRGPTTTGSGQFADVVKLTWDLLKSARG